jgi:hypothetical protein
MSRPGRGDTHKKHMMHVRRVNEMRRGGVKELMPNIAPYSYAFVPIHQHAHDVASRFYADKAEKVAQAYGKKAGEEQEELMSAANSFLELRRDLKPVVQMVQNIEEMGKDIEAALTLSNMKGGGYFKKKLDEDIKFLSADLQKKVSPEKFKEFTTRVAKLRVLAVDELRKHLTRRDFQRLIVESDFYQYLVDKENPKEIIVARYSRFVRALFFFYADGSPLPDDFPAV